MHHKAFSTALWENLLILSGHLVGNSGQAMEDHGWSMAVACSHSMKQCHMPT